MDVARTWRRLDAEHWVHVWGMVVTTLLGFCTWGVLVMGFVYGASVTAVVPGAVAALSGWLTSAWRRELPWAWWVWTSGSVLVGMMAVSSVFEGGPVVLVLLVLDGILLALLLHPDSRARVDAAAPLAR